jgi:hypothetical protein
MTGKEFFESLANGKKDVIQTFLDALSAANADYCVIGGLAVNAYADPVVSLDLDMAVAISHIEKICEAVKEHFKIERFAHSVNLTPYESDVRIQLQTDPRYQEFIAGASSHTVLGYEMKVAGIEDVLKGKLWAYSDKQRRQSKRQKDLADILRLVETHPYLSDQLPDSVREMIE